jgi:hypothetical protein
MVAILVDKWLTVHESDAMVDTNIELQNGDWIDIAASGSTQISEPLAVIV